MVRTVATVSNTLWPWTGAHYELDCQTSFMIFPAVIFILDTSIFFGKLKSFTFIITFLLVDKIFFILKRSNADFSVVS